MECHFKVFGFASDIPVFLVHNFFFISSVRVAKIYYLGGVGEEIEGVALDYRIQKPTEQVILFRGFLRSPHPSSSGSPPTPKDVAKPQLSSSMAAPHFHSSSSLQVQVQVQPG